MVCFECEPAMLRSGAGRTLCGRGFSGPPTQSRSTIRPSRFGVRRLWDGWVESKRANQSVWSAQASRAFSSGSKGVGARENPWLGFDMKRVEAHWKKGGRIRAEWQQRYNEQQQQQPDQANTASQAGRTVYVLPMFPYPSGALHMGHVRVYSISDVMAHYHRFQGAQVLHPMGWDAFGLPAENAARQHHVQPQDWTRQNIASMKEQLIHLGLTFDWDREVATCDPSYYRWTQWIFLQLLAQNLVYQAEALVNWDPVDRTVLADEQVDENGRSWRSGAVVEKKPLKQWFVRSTQYAQSLLDGLDESVLTGWRDVVSMQRSWIGPCDGFKFKFGLNAELESQDLWVWTSRPELLWGSAFVGITPEHILAQTHDQSELPEFQINEGRVQRLPLQAVNPMDPKHILPILLFHDTDDFPSESDHFLGIPEICAMTKSDGRFVPESEVDLSQEPLVEKSSGEEVISYWDKMSKSKFNGVDPKHVIDKYGCDTTRLMMLAEASPTAERLWSEDSYTSINQLQTRFLKLLRLAQSVHVEEVKGSVRSKEFKAHEERLINSRNFHVSGTNFAYATTSNLRFVVHKIQSLLKDLWITPDVVKRDCVEFQRGLATAIILMTPMSPHFCAELWEGLRQVKVKQCPNYRWDKTVFHQDWPQMDRDWKLSLGVEFKDKNIDQIPLSIDTLNDLTHKSALKLVEERPQYQAIFGTNPVLSEFHVEKDHRAVLNVKFDMAKMSPQQRKQLREQEKEEKRRKRERRQEKIAAFQAIEAKKTVK
eukprot:TCALIF_04272-PA protein Name:"Similar to SPAC4G8.09 Putative leucine--tRNA ligase, mitochondrial (Schizosaccharomyces pombe (strain 972 / ATCC 24843))" AED:0.13 eAED:0.13 QI:25/0.87/0.88/1/0.5/0.33/9/42/765